MKKRKPCKYSGKINTFKDCVESLCTYMDVKTVKVSLQLSYGFSCRKTWKKLWKSCQKWVRFCSPFSKRFLDVLGTLLDGFSAVFSSLGALFGCTDGRKGRKILQEAGKEEREGGRREEKEESRVKKVARGSCSHFSSLARGQVW